MTEAIRYFPPGHIGAQIARYGRRIIHSSVFESLITCREDAGCALLVNGSPDLVEYAKEMATLMTDLITLDRCAHTEGVNLRHARNDHF